MILSSSHFDPDLPYWQDYLPFLTRLEGTDFPSCAQLNDLLPTGLCSKDGHPIHFVASDQLAEDNYENRIYTTGQVSTRAGSWHDLFNALVWMRFPHIKVAMNALHYSAGAKHKRHHRGQLRDALTLFDECGVIVFSDHAELLEALAKRRWSDAFLDGRFQSRVTLSLCGHAMLEKYLSPYKGMTAKALLILVNTEFLALPRTELLEHFDLEIASEMLRGQLIRKPADLSPLPLAGVPGWWPLQDQDTDRFYKDLDVFRPSATGLVPAPILDYRRT